MVINDDIKWKVEAELNDSRVKKWTEALRGFAPMSNKQMRLYVRDYPEKYEVFRDIISFFTKFSDEVSERRLVDIIRSKQAELGHVNLNMAKFAGIKQYIRFYEQKSE